MATRSTKAKVAQRVEDVLRIMLLGGEIHDLREYAREQKWGVCDGTLYRYLAEAWELCKARVEKDRDKLIARHLLSRRTLFARAMEANDVRTALAVVKDEAEMQGLYPAATVAAKVEHSGKVAVEPTTITIQIVDKRPDAKNATPDGKPASNAG